MLLNSRLFSYDWFGSVATSNNIDDPIVSSPDDLGSFARWAFEGEPNAAPYVQLSKSEIKSIAGRRLYDNCYGDHNGHKNSQDDNEAPTEGVMTPGPLEETA